MQQSMTVQDRRRDRYLGVFTKAYSSILLTFLNSFPHSLFSPGLRRNVSLGKRKAQVGKHHRCILLVMSAVQSIIFPVFRVDTFIVIQTFARTSLIMWNLLGSIPFR